MLETASYKIVRRMAVRPNVIRSGTASMEHRYKKGSD